MKEANVLKQEIKTLKAELKLANHELWRYKFGCSDGGKFTKEKDELENILKNEQKVLRDMKLNR